VNDDYYDEQDIAVIVTYRIKWNKQDPAARADAIRTALSLPKSGGGAGPHGCYRADQIEVRADD